MRVRNVGIRISREDFPVQTVSGLVEDEIRTTGFTLHREEIEWLDWTFQRPTSKRYWQVSGNKDVHPDKDGDYGFRWGSAFFILRLRENPYELSCIQYYSPRLRSQESFLSA